MRRMLPSHLLKRRGTRAAPGVLLGVLLVLTAASGWPAGEAGGGRDELRQAGEELAQLVNELRAAHGLPGLRMNEGLGRACRRHAEEMAARDTLDHVLEGRGPSERARAEGFEGPVAENIAAGDEGTPEGLFALWASSELHRANMLAPGHGEMGVGCARAGKNGRLYCVAMFGAQR